MYDIKFYFVGFLSFFENVFKIIVKGVFLFVDDNEVIKMLNDFNVFFISEFKYEKIWYLIIRKMIGILNGNCFIYVKFFVEGMFLFCIVICVGFWCFIYYYG